MDDAAIVVNSRGILLDGDGQLFVALTLDNVLTHGFLTSTGPNPLSWLGRKRSLSEYCQAFDLRPIRDCLDRGKCA